MTALSPGSFGFNSIFSSSSPYVGKVIVFWCINYGMKCAFYLFILLDAVYDLVPALLLPAGKKGVEDELEDQETGGHVEHQVPRLKAPLKITNFTVRKNKH